MTFINQEGLHPFCKNGRIDGLNRRRPLLMQSIICLTRTKTQTVASLVRRGCKNVLQNSSVICIILLCVCDGRILNCVLLPATESLPKDRDKNSHPCDCVCVCVCVYDDGNHQVTDISLVPVEVLFRTSRIKRFFFFFFFSFFVVLFPCC